MIDYRVCAVVPTYNRKELLTKCIKSILSGTVSPKNIIVVDNASTDGTKEHIESLFSQEIEQGKIIYVRLEENMGGAGGFAAGLKKGMEMDVDYFWLMDDDAEPTKNALSELIKRAALRLCLVSLPTDKNKQELSWGVGIRIKNKIKTFVFLSDIPTNCVLEAPFAPLIGMFIPKSIVYAIGFPREDYFIWGDDVEYIHRMWENGYKVMYVRESIIFHPVQKKIITNFLWKKNIVLIDAPDWKQYYGLRNHVHLLSRRGKWLDTIGRIVYFLLIWKARGGKLNTLHFYLKGIWHGFTGKLGRNDKIMPGN
ncbi:MAG: glycosyltransferase [Thermodesulforhabdaceae bacterium]